MYCMVCAIMYVNKTSTNAGGTEKTPKRRGGNRIPDPHDAFIKALLSDPNRLLSLLLDQLPREITELFSKSPPVIVESNFFGDDLRKSQADLLVKVEMTSGEPGFFYVLVEHKSYQDPAVVLQMMGYSARIWRNYVQKGKKLARRTTRARALPKIIPFLIYTGSEPWKGPTGLSDMMAPGAPELNFQNGFDLVLRQWAQMSPGELSRDPVLRVGQITLTGRWLAHQDEIEEALVDDPDLQFKFGAYIWNTGEGAELEKYLAGAKAKKRKGVMGVIMEQLRAEGRIEGVAEGEVRGIAKGEAKSLTRLLERRFGPLPAAVKTRVGGANLSQLDAWIDRVLDAKSLDSVFGAVE